MVSVLKLLNNCFNPKRPERQNRSNYFKLVDPQGREHDIQQAIFGNSNFGGNAVLQMSIDSCRLSCFKSLTL